MPATRVSLRSLRPRFSVFAESSPELLDYAGKMKVVAGGKGS
jgi:hypothetical protein